MNQTDLRTIESSLGILLDIIQSNRDPKFIRAYEKLLEAQDLIHSIRRQEQKNEDLQERNPKREEK